MIFKIFKIRWIKRNKFKEFNLLQYKMAFNNFKMNLVRIFKIFKLI